MVEERMQAVPALVAQMIREDREFITAETVSMFSMCSMPEAAVALTRLGYSPAQIGPCGEDPDGRPHPLPVIVTTSYGMARGCDAPERVFTVMKGRRWTKVPEYLSNGQLTARWFVDESTGEVRSADGWTKPKSWACDPQTTAFVLALLAQWRAGDGGRSAVA